MPRGGGRVEKKKPRTYYRHVLSELDAELQQAQQAVEQLLSERKEQAHREQVLVDTILQLEDVIVFRLVFDAQLAAGAVNGPQQPQSAQQQQLQGLTQPEKHQSVGPCSRYVTSLLAKVSTETVQSVLNWQVEDWSNFVSNTSKQLAILLDLTDRENDGFADQDQDNEGSATYNSVTQQQLEELVDSFVTVGSLGVIYSDVIGQKVGVCNTINHITGRQEAPSQLHWQRVVRRLQLTEQQRQQLAAGYHQFNLVKQLQQQVQRAVANLVACPNSCSLQVQAAAKEEAAASSSSISSGIAGNGTASSGGSGGGSGNGGSSSSIWDLSETGDNGLQQNGHDRASPTTSGSIAVPATPAAATTAPLDAAALGTGGSPEEGPDLLQLTERLLFMWNQSCVSLMLLLFNTLTKQQIARMAVASYPFVPRPGPVVEAAVQMQPAFGTDAEAVGAEVGGTAQQLRQHMQLRSTVLSQQHGRWWQDYQQQHQQEHIPQ